MTLFYHACPDAECHCFDSSRLSWMTAGFHDVNAERVPRLLAPFLNVAAILTRRVYFWYRDTSTGRRHLWFGK